MGTGDVPVCRATRGIATCRRQRGQNGYVAILFALPSLIGIFATTAVCAQPSEHLKHYKGTPYQDGRFKAARRRFPDGWDAPTMIAVENTKTRALLGCDFPLEKAFSPCAFLTGGNMNLAYFDFKASR